MMAPSSLKKMRGSMDRQEGNNASFQSPPKKRLKIHDRGLTLLPGQIPEVDEGDKTVHEQTQTPSISTPTSTVSPENPTVESTPFKDSECPNTRRNFQVQSSSSQHNLRGPGFSNSTIGGCPEVPSERIPQPPRSVCDQPASVKSPPSRLPGCAGPRKASVEHFNAAASPSLLNKQCTSRRHDHVVVNANRLRFTCDHLGGRRRIGSTHSRCTSEPTTTLGPRSIDDTASYESNSRKTMGEYQNPETSAVAIELGAKRNSRSWTKHFPSAVAKTPFLQKTSPPFFSGIYAKTSPAYRKSFHLSQIQPERSFSFKSRSLSSSSSTLRHRDGTRAAIAVTSTPSFPTYQQAQHRRRSISLPAMCSTSNTGSLGSPAIEFQFTVAPHDTPLTLLSESIDMPSSDIVPAEVESCLDDDHIHFHSPDSPTTSFDPNTFFSSISSHGNNVAPAACSTVPKHSATENQKEYFTAAEVRNLLSQQRTTAEKRVQSIIVERDDYARKYNALSYTHGRLDAAYQKEITDKADVKSRLAKALKDKKASERNLNQTRKRLEETTTQFDTIVHYLHNQTQLSANENQHAATEYQAFDANDMALMESMPSFDVGLGAVNPSQDFATPSFEDLPSATFDGTVLPAVTPEQYDIMMSMVPFDFDDVFSDNYQGADGAADTIVPGDMALNEAGNAAAPIDLTISPTPSNRSSSNPRGRSRLTPEERRENTRRSKKANRENTAARKKLEQDHPNDPALVEAGMAGAKTYGGRPSKVGKRQSRSKS